MIRLLRMLVVVPYFLLGVVWVRLALWVDRRRGRELAPGGGLHAQLVWCRWFCRLFGIRLSHVDARAPERPALIVANHISWLDIICLLASWPVVFLSKSEVRRWPLVGEVATGVGTVYLYRGQRGAAQNAIRTMSERLRAGYWVVLFPEGTTSDGRDVLTFRPRLYQAAIDAAAPVQPVTIGYRLPDGRPCAEAPFLGQQTLLANVWALAAVPRLDARIAVSDAIHPSGQGRSALARRSHESVLANLAPDADDIGSVSNHLTRAKPPGSVQNKARGAQLGDSQ